jgi:cell division protease FtsH
VNEVLSWVRELLPRWIARSSPTHPNGRGPLPRPLLLFAVAMLIAVAAGGIVAWKLLSQPIPIVAYSEIATGLDDGRVRELSVQKNGTRLVAIYSDPVLGPRVVAAILPAGALELVDLERWAQAGAEVQVDRASASQGQYVSLFFLVVVGGGVLLLMVRAHRGSSRRFGTTPADRQLTLADVGGAREATAELRDVIEYLKAPARFDAMGASCPTGVLLVGPPGTGKTLLARAVAGESGVPVIVASGSEFSEMYVGVGARRVRDLAKKARKLAPCIVFIDEFDSIGGRRGRPNRTGEEETTLNQLLVEMDGLSGSSGVVWMAATNRDDMLDPAVRRPGRFDRVVEVGLPDSGDRLEILRLHAARRPLAEDVDLEMLAAVTVGYSGADLANLLNEAAIIAVQEEGTEISGRHVELARDKVMLGRLRSGVIVSDDEKRLIALHEAGHAVVGLVACPEDRLHKVTIEARGRSLGAAHFAPDVDRHLYSRRYLEGVVAKALGGRAAETVFLGPDAVTSGAGSDLVHATGVARRMVAEFGMSPEIGLVSADPAAQGGAPSGHLQGEIDRAVRALIEAQSERAEGIVRTHREAVAAVAAALEEKTILLAHQVEEIVSGHGVAIDPDARWRRAAAAAIAAAAVTA